MLLANKVMDPWSQEYVIYDPCVLSNELCSYPNRFSFLTGLGNNTIVADPPFSCPVSTSVIATPLFAMHLQLNYLCTTLACVPVAGLRNRAFLATWIRISLWHYGYICKNDYRIVPCKRPRALAAQVRKIGGGPLHGGGALNSPTMPVQAPTPDPKLTDRRRSFARASFFMQTRPARQ